VTFTTAKAAAKLRLVADRGAIDATREDLAYVVAEVVDADGVLVACADEHAGSSCGEKGTRVSIVHPLFHAKID
jgi:hypothetical protein